MPFHAYDAFTFVRVVSVVPHIRCKCAVEQGLSVAARRKILYGTSFMIHRAETDVPKSLHIGKDLAPRGELAQLVRPRPPASCKKTVLLAVLPVSVLAVTHVNEPETRP